MSGGLVAKAPHDSQEVQGSIPLTLALGLA